MDHIFDMRGMIRLGVVQSVNDMGGVQTVTVKTEDGFVRSDITVLQPFGLASSPPVDGAVALLLAVGGDPGHYVALPLGNPAKRFGAQAPGETAIYQHAGARVHVRADGTVEVHAASQVLIKATATVVIDAPTVSMTGDLNVTGNVSDGHGSLARLRGNYDAHKHGGGPTTDHPD